MSSQIPQAEAQMDDPGNIDVLGTLDYVAVAAYYILVLIASVVDHKRREEEIVEEYIIPNEEQSEEQPPLPLVPPVFYNIGIHNERGDETARVQFAVVRKHIVGHSHEDQALLLPCGHFTKEAATETHYDHINVQHQEACDGVRHLTRCLIVKPGHFCAWSEECDKDCFLFRRLQNVSACRPNRNTLSGYFLAGRFMTWLPVGASLFASNIGSEHFIGLAGSGAASGIAVGAFELNALILLQVLGWIFLPVFIASGVCTLPEYMNRRFGGGRIRFCLAALSLILYIFTKISVNIYSGSLFIQQAMGWNIWYSILLLLALTYLCSAIGGLAAVIYMETLQFFIIIFGSLIVMITGFIEVGGWNELVTKYLKAVPNETFVNSTCGVPRQDSWIMLRDPIDSDMPWPAFLLGQTPASIWYWCADQLMVQRALAAKSLSHAQGGTLLAGYVKILPVFLMVIPGMISRVLYTNEIACVKPEICEKICGNPVSCSNSAYPRLVLGTLPTGMRGVMLAVMLAALMSDLSSVFNSASTLFTMDMWKRARKQATTKELLIVSKIFTAVLVVISIIWIPIIQKTQGGQLYIYIQSVAAYLAPPIAAIYCLALAWPRMNEKGAFWGLMTGLAVGIVRMGLDFSFPEPNCYEEDTRPLIVSKVHYMYFAMILFWTTIILASAVTLCTPPLPEYRLIRTTYMTRFDKRARDDDNQPLRVEELELMMAAQRKAAESEADGQANKIPNDGCEKATIMMRLFRWVCAVETKPEKEQRIARDAQDKLDQERDPERELRIARDAEEYINKKKVNTLEQTPGEKKILNTCLAVIITAAIGLYVFFSINPLTAEETEFLRMDAYNRSLYHYLYHGNSTS